MPVIVVRGVVTRYVDYRENDRIITIVTAENGRIDAKARGCRRQTSKLLSCAQPFVYGEFELYSAKDKYTVNSGAVTESFYPIREDVARFAAGTAMLQLTGEAVQENEPAQRLFSLLYHGLSFLAYGENDPADLLICFLIRLMEASGFTPSITRCARCGRDVRSDERLLFGSRPGGAVCAACARGERPVTKRALEALRRMLLLTDEQMGRVTLPQELRRELTPLMTEYAENVMETGSRALALFKQLT